jgi:hypothetical protein
MTPHRILGAIFYALAGLLAVVGLGLEGPAGIKAMLAAVMFAILGGVCSLGAAVSDLRLTLGLRLAEPSVVADVPPTPAPPELPKARPYARPPWEKPE